MTDADGNQLPYLDSIDVPGHRGLGDRRRGARGRRPRPRHDLERPGDRATSRSSATSSTSTCRTSYLETGYLLIDLDKPGPLQDRRVRCAMSMAIDRDELNDATNGGLQRRRQRTVLPRPAGLPRGQRPVARAGPRRRRGDDRRVRGRDRHRRRASPSGTSRPTSSCRSAELLMGWWSEIGIDVDDQTVPQNDFINLAVFGVPEFQVFSWRQHAGVVRRPAVPLVALRERLPRR